MTQSWLTQTRRRHGMNRSRIGGEIRMTPDQDVGKAIHFAIALALERFDDVPDFCDRVLRLGVLLALANQVDPRGAVTGGLVLFLLACAFALLPHGK